MPDLCGGDAIAPDAIDFMLKPAKSWLHRIFNVFYGLTKIPFLISWVSRHGDKSVEPLLPPFIADVRARLGVTRVATMGYCWGGRYSLLMGTGEPWPAVDVAMAAHPSRIKTDEIAKMKAREQGAAHPPQLPAASAASFRAKPGSPPAAGDPASDRRPTALRCRRCRCPRCSKSPKMTTTLMRRRRRRRRRRWRSGRRAHLRRASSTTRAPRTASPLVETKCAPPARLRRRPTTAHDDAVK